MQRTAKARLLQAAVEGQVSETRPRQGEYSFTGIIGRSFMDTVLVMKEDLRQQLVTTASNPQSSEINDPDRLLKPTQRNLTAGLNRS